MQLIDGSSMTRRWNPLPMDFLLEKYGLGKRSVQVLLVLWVLTIGLSIASIMILSPTDAFLGKAGQQSLYTFFMLYPPLILGTIMLFWLGFEWGFIPVFLSAFLIAYASNMPVYWAILFGVAFILGLAIFALCYHSVPISPRLNSLKNIAFFTTVAFIAALASSLGSFVWSLYHDLSAVDTIIVWKGWWTGVFLQSMLLVGPFLYFFTPTVERMKSHYFDIPEGEVSLKWIYSAIGSVVVVLTLFIISANILGSTGIQEELALLPARFEENFMRVTDSFQIISWISIGLILAAGLGGIYLVGSWNKSLSEKVEEQTRQLKENEVSLKVAIAERDSLLTKIHKRVNNNIIMMLALLELQLKTKDKKTVEEILKDSHARLRSMAVIYETMYQTESTNYVNLKYYAVKLSNKISRSYKKEGRNIEVSIKADELNIEVEKAVPFAMILNELLINSYVHAFKEKSSGTIFIEIKEKDQCLVLAVRDSGEGLPAHFEIAKQDTLGMKLIQTLTKQLNGEFSVDRQEKAGFTLRMPVPNQASNPNSNTANAA